MIAEAGDAGDASLLRQVHAEQLRMSVEQVRRIPAPHFFLDCCVAWTGWHAGLYRFSLAWLVVMTVSQLGRTVHATRAYTRRPDPPGPLLLQLATMLVGLGAIHAVFMIVLFSRPVTDSHYIVTMIMVGNAAGAVSPAAGHLRSYVAWAAVFGGTLAACWLARGTLEGGAIALLVVFLFTILTLYVRDQGLTLTKLVSLSEQLRRERDRVKAAGEAKTRFFAAASHDLRQPLTALSYNAATVQALAAARDDETLVRVSDGIARALAESRGLLDCLLEVSQLDANVIQAHIEPVDVGLVARQVCDEARPIAAEHGLVLSAAVACEGAVVADTDESILRRILQNLVGNAIKFTPAGSVEVALEMLEPAEGNVARVSVRDTGLGIDPAVQERIFEEFFQVGNAERNRSRGLGLGLSIVRRLAELIEADITLQSAPGHGATFGVLLRQARVERAVEARPNLVAEFAAAGGRSVLLVDDEPDIREALATFLGTLGWRVVAVQDGSQASRACDAGLAPDAVIVDFRLREGQSGLDVLDALRARGCDAPAWLITGETSPARILAARGAGVPVIYKPVDGMALASMLEAALCQPHSG